jgi:hypothetical protein
VKRGGTVKRSSPPRRTSWLRPGQPPKRSGRIRSSQQRITTRRVSKRFKHRRDPDYKAWIKTLPCLVAGLPRVQELHGVERTGPSTDVGDRSIPPT